MRRLFIAVVILLLTLGQAQAVDQFFVYKNAALSTTSVLVTFGIQARSVTVTNFSAANILYVDWTGGTATNADHELRATQSYTTPPNIGRFGRLAVVCSAATCDMQVLAVN